MVKAGLKWQGLIFCEQKNKFVMSTQEVGLEMDFPFHSPHC